MRIFNKKTLCCQIQDASFIGIFLGAIGACAGTFLTDVSVTPAIVSCATIGASTIGVIASSYLEKRDEDEEVEEEINEDDYVDEVNFHKLAKVYKIEGNIVKVDFKKISKIREKTMKLEYKNRSN